MVEAPSPRRRLTRAGVRCCQASPTTASMRIKAFGRSSHVPEGGDRFAGVLDAPFQDRSHLTRECALSGSVTEASFSRERAGSGANWTQLAITAVHRRRSYAHLVVQLFDDPFDDRRDRARRISQVTRRDIFDYLRTEGGPWWGRLSEVAFLARLYNLEALPSTDSRLRRRTVISVNTEWPTTTGTTTGYSTTHDSGSQVVLTRCSWVSLPKWSIRSFSQTPAEPRRLFRR